MDIRNKCKDSKNKEGLPCGEAPKTRNKRDCDSSAGDCKVHRYGVLATSKLAVGDSAKGPRCGNIKDFSLWSQQFWLTNARVNTQLQKQPGSI
jgi:hypothetical protein